MREEFCDFLAATLIVNEKNTLGANELREIPDLRSVPTLLNLHLNNNKITAIANLGVFEFSMCRRQGGGGRRQRSW